MDYAYHYQTHEVIPGSHGQPERRHELLSEYFQTVGNAIARLNSSIILLKRNKDEYFLPVSVDIIKASLRDNNLFIITLHLPDGNIHALSITFNNELI